MSRIRAQLVKMASSLSKQAARPLYPSELAGRVAGENLLNARIWNAEMNRNLGSAGRMGEIYGKGSDKALKEQARAAGSKVSRDMNLEEAKYMAHEVGPAHKAKQLAAAEVPASQAQANLKSFLAASRAPEQALARPSLLQKLLSKIR